MSCSDSEATMESSFERKLARYISSLFERKTELELRISEEMKKRLPCAFTLQRLKKQKLKTKDRMAELRRQMNRTTAETSS